MTPTISFTLIATRNHRHYIFPGKAHPALSNAEIIRLSVRLLERDAGERMPEGVEFGVVRHEEVEVRLGVEGVAEVVEM